MATGTVSVFEAANIATIKALNTTDIPNIAEELSSHKSSASINAHQISNISGLVDALSNKAPSSHTHTISNVSGLQSALDGKQNTISGYSGNLIVITSVDFVNQTVDTANINIVNGIITQII